MGVKKEETKSLALLEDPAKPNINTIPKQRNSMTNLNKQLNLSRMNSVASLSSSDPYYAHPVSPPRPVTPPRPKSPENFKQTNNVQTQIIKPINNLQSFSQNIQPIQSSMHNKVEMPNNLVPNIYNSQQNLTQAKPKPPSIYIPPEPKSPLILKPSRPISPEIISSDDDTPPPRPASPIFQYPSIPRSMPASNANVSNSLKGNSSKQRNISAPESPMHREEVKTPANRKSMTYEKDNLAELVTAHFVSRNMNSRSSTPQGPSSGYHSRPFTPQELLHSQSKSIIPQEIVHSQSKSRIPTDLIQSQSKSRIPQEIVHSHSKSRIPVARNPSTPMNNFYRDSRPTTPLLSKQSSFSNFGQFSSSQQRFDDHHNGRHSSYIDDSDYGAYQMSRDFVRTPSIIDERALSRIGSTSLISENDYSAFTPVAVRKMSVSSVSTPLATPKLTRDFGFVSSKKESMPKPPRRRSKEPGFDSRPQSRQIKSSSRETTPVNNPLSPVRPSRIRGKNYPQQRPNKNCDNNKLNRPKSLQENSPEPLYEILTPPSNTFHAANRRNYSSSDSDSDDFRTPQASPKFIRPSTKNKNKNIATRKSDIYEDIEVGQSYENFNDNPILEKSKKISRMITKQDKDYALPTKINKPKIIPPRTCQEPIPTPRKSSLTRSRNQSTESINRMKLQHKNCPKQHRRVKSH